MISNLFVYDNTLFSTFIIYFPPWNEFLLLGNFPGIFPNHVFLPGLIHLCRVERLLFLQCVVYQVTGRGPFIINAHIILFWHMVTLLILYFKHPRTSHPPQITEWNSTRRVTSILNDDSDNNPTLGFTYFYYRITYREGNTNATPLDTYYYTIRKKRFFIRFATGGRWRLPGGSSARADYLLDIWRYMETNNMKRDF